MLFGDLVLLLAGGAVHHWDVIGLGPGAQTTAEASCHAHQMVVIQVFIRAVQFPPPHTKPSARLAHGEVGVQNDAIDAIVTTFQKLAVKRAQLVWHGDLLRVVDYNSERKTAPLPLQAPRQSCPVGATFSRRSPRKSVATFRRKIRAGGYLGERAG